SWVWVIRRGNRHRYTTPSTPMRRDPFFRTATAAPSGTERRGFYPPCLHAKEDHPASRARRIESCWAKPPVRPALLEFRSDLTNAILSPRAAPPQALPSY